ncbi:trehalose-6-phosphate synthase/phosphatase [Scenedesmus sp. NREL 46B-D3]|nr:trehalose-6-phosphate synthase/phosphatase [Scenedesmus sp. NREL 46B-D3]
MKTMGGSYHNLAALATADFSDARQAQATRLIIVSNVLPIRAKREAEGWQFEWDEDALVAQAKVCRTSGSSRGDTPPLTAAAAAVAAAAESRATAVVEGVPDEFEVVFVGSLSVDVDVMEQEEVALQLKQQHNCAPVFIAPDVREKYYKGFCKQQLWPLFHYVLPMSPSSAGRFNSELWQAYVKANKTFMEKVVEECASDTDYVWIHDYHLLVLPSLLRKRFNKIRCGLFLHSPFPSSEIFRTFPKREELLRSMLNADLIGAAAAASFHTFDYARHFLSCASRMLGLEHETLRGAISIEYYGRNVGIKIMPTGVNPQRLLEGFSWPEFKWRRGELVSSGSSSGTAAAAGRVSQFEGCQVLLGVDDLDVFKGIELKLQAFERLLEEHPEWRGKAVLVQVRACCYVVAVWEARGVQGVAAEGGSSDDRVFVVRDKSELKITNAPRSSGKELAELHEAAKALVAAINGRWSSPGYQPVCYLERHVPLHERIAFYTVADVAVVTATRDGMNLVPYEYVVCRQGPPGWAEPEHKSQSMLVVSEFVGCSPSLSGAIRVNPWSIDAVADAMFSAIKTSPEHRSLRHDKHWKYVSEHTVGFWATSYVQDLARSTKQHVAMKCYGLGLGLDTFRLVALDANFKKLEDSATMAAYRRCAGAAHSRTAAGFRACRAPPFIPLRRRLLLLDYDGTLIPHRNISAAPPETVLQVLRGLTSDACNEVWVISGRSQQELGGWFEGVPGVGLAAEHGFFIRPPWRSRWYSRFPLADHTWQAMVLPILKQPMAGMAHIEVKASALVWHYGDADPDFGNWQAKELLDHLEDVLSNKPIEVISGNTIVEAKPQGISKGSLVELICKRDPLVTGELPPSMPGSTNAPAATPDSAAPGSGSSHVDGLPPGAGAAAVAAHSLGMAGPAGGQQWQASHAAAAAGGPPPLPRQPMHQQQMQQQQQQQAAADAAGGGSSRGLAGGAVDFVLAVGDDRSDEDMFTAIEQYADTPRHPAEVFACVVGQRPSKAKFYVNDTNEVVELLAKMAGVSLPPRNDSF